jgi:Uma2 family endonuclease
MTVTAHRLWIVDDYHRMMDAGILTIADKVELLQGEIVERSPQYSPLASRTQRSAHYLTRLLAEKAYIRVQLPVTLEPDSEPEPDVAIVKIDPQDYFAHHPTADDIYLLVEVADSTLQKDRQQKAKIYLRSNIPEYWILDIQNWLVITLRQPGSEGYSQETILELNARLNLVTFPDVWVDIKDLFPQVNVS